MPLPNVRDYWPGVGLVKMRPRISLWGSFRASIPQSVGIRSEMAEYWRMSQGMDFDLQTCKPATSKHSANGLKGICKYPTNNLQYANNLSIWLSLRNSIFVPPFWLVILRKNLFFHWLLLSKSRFYSIAVTSLVFSLFLWCRVVTLYPYCVSRWNYTNRKFKCSDWYLDKRISSHWQLVQLCS